MSERPNAPGGWGEHEQLAAELAQLRAENTRLLRLLRLTRRAAADLATLHGRRAVTGDAA